MTVLFSSRMATSSVFSVCMHTVMACTYITASPICNCAYNGSTLVLQCWHPWVDTYVALYPCDMLCTCARIQWNMLGHAYILHGRGHMRCSVMIILQATSPSYALLQWLVRKTQIQWTHDDSTAWKQHTISASMRTVDEQKIEARFFRKYESDYSIALTCSTFVQYRSSQLQI